MKPAPLTGSRLPRISAWTLIALAWLILFARRPEAFLHPQFWAEDFLFLGEAERSGFRSLFIQLAGYLHFIPRIIAWVVSPCDPLIQPALYTLGSLGVVTAVLLGCLSPRHDLPWKPVLALAVVLVPHTGEVFFNPTNAQWIAALALLLTACKRDPDTPAEAITDVLTLVLAGLSGPFVVFALPGFALRAWFRRSRSSLRYLALTVAAAVIQVSFILSHPQPPEYTGDFSLNHLATTVAFRLPYTLFLGVAATTQSGPVLPLLVGFAVLGLLVWAAFRVRTHRVELATFVLFTALLLASTALRKRFDLWPFGDMLNGDRYFFLPKVLLLWTLAIFAAQVAPGRLQSILVALLVVGGVLNLPRFSFVRQKIHPWYSLCPDIRREKPVEVKINPDWTFRYQRNHRLEGPM